MNSADSSRPSLAIRILLGVGIGGCLFAAVVLVLYLSITFGLWVFAVSCLAGGVAISFYITRVTDALPGNLSGRKH